jgi:two-component system, chemotaxis family, response regulator PixG
MRQDYIKFKDLIAEFKSIKANAFSGNLIIEVADIPSWMFCFCSGRLAGISGGIDPIDRWKRNLALASLNVPLDRLVKSTNDREIFFNSNKLAQEWAVKEVLFDIIQFSQNKSDRLFCQIIPIVGNNTQSNSSVPLLEIQPILSVTIQSWQEWGQHELASYAPSLFVIIHKPDQISDFDDNKDLQYLISSIDGNKSLRSLAIHHQKKLIDIVESLLPLLKLGIISLSLVKQTSKELDIKIRDSADRVSIVPQLDLDTPVQKLRQSTGIYLPDGTLFPTETPPVDRLVATNASPLIACIDDSVLVCKNLEKIITENGYRYLGVQDPFKIIRSLIAHKPDLIFLDLVMPITNGYEVCEQIRKTPCLANVPIIILTGNDGLIDRVRTKFVGANGFLGKPINPESILKMIDKHLDRKQLNKTVNYVDRADRISIYPEPISGHVQSHLLHGIDKRVLVVDDDLHIREVVSMCLQKLKGWDVSTAASGQEGLNGLHTNNPDAIVLDVMMPEMDGLAFLRQLRANPHHQLIPVILLTANRYLPDKDLLTELGVVEIVSKPFLPVNLVRQIDRALDLN